MWSNCLAGWWLGGGWAGETREQVRLALLLVGTSLLYTAGAWLNDVYDSAWDARHRPERPIPAGGVRRQTVQRAAMAALALGWICLLPLGFVTACWTLALTACIEAYNRVHARWEHAPSLLAACRFCLYPLAASVASGGNVPLALVGGATLAGYVAGISYLARGGGLPGEPTPRWPWALLVGVPLAGWWWLSRHAAYDPRLSWVLLWPFGARMWQAWRHMTRARPDHLPGGPPVGDLLAAIALLDLMLSPSLDVPRLATFAGLFVATRLLQRYVPIG